MSDIAIADTPESDVKNSGEDENALMDSLGSLIEERGKMHEAFASSEIPVEQEEETPEVEEAEAVEELDTGQSEIEDVLSKFNVDEILNAIASGEIPEDKVKEIGKALSQKAVGRFGEFTRKLKEKDAELAKIRNESPQEETTSKPSGLLDSVNTATELQSFKVEQEETLDWIEDKLDHSTHLDSGDIAFSEGDVQYTKGQLLNLKKQIRNVLRTELPKREAIIRASERNAEELPKLEAAAAEEIGWLLDEESKGYVAYQRLREDNLVNALYQAFPQYTARLDYVIKHAVNSMHTVNESRNPNKAAEPAKPKVEERMAPQPGMGSSGAAPRSGTGNSIAAKLKEASEAFNKSNSESDLLKLRTLEHTLSKYAK